MRILPNISLFTFVFIFCFSCQKIDSFMFENIASNEYLLDDYIGPSEATLDSSYAIIQDNIHEWTFESEGEQIYGIYTGDISKID